MKSQNFLKRVSNLSQWKVKTFLKGPQIFHNEKSKPFKKGLSPLTVAAFLAHTEMFFHILNIDRDIYWQVMLIQLDMMISWYHYDNIIILEGNIDMMISWQSFQIGNVVCAAYPLTVVDTIDVHTGELNERSALNMIVFGVGKSMLNPVDIVDDDPEERSPSGHDRGGGRGLSESQVERFHRRQVFFFLNLTQTRFASVPNLPKH